MYVMEQEYTEHEMTVWLQEVTNTSSAFHTKIMEPIIQVLETPKGRKDYISLGTEFLDANAGMLSKEFPTKRVSYPRKYVDRVVELFSFTNQDLKEIFKELLQSEVSDKTDFKTLTSTPTNLIHAAALVYSDMVQHRELRDSAKQQLGITMYGIVLNHFFPDAEPSVPIMTYTYMHLDNSWGLVKSENIINWIGQTTETSFAFWRAKMSLEMSVNIMVQFLNRLRSSFQQNMRTLARKYYDNVENGNAIGEDLKGDEDYVETTNTTTLRNNLVRLITTGDKDYKTKGQLYKATAEQKNVKVDELYELAQRVETKDITNIIDLIFYVFIAKENHKLNEINSTAYISRITKMPTAVDRAIPGKPVIDPFCKRYGCGDLVAKAYICLLATFIILKIDKVKT